jgi:P27 family predicted phage terminase small subunit
MTAGRPPKPTALKVLHGTTRPDRANSSEPTPPAGPVSPPSWLRGRARTLFKARAALLVGMKVATTADADALALYCAAYTEFIECDEFIREHGRSYTSVGEGGITIRRPHPEVRMRADAWRRVQRMASEFGLSPSSRSKLHIESGEEPADPFAEWERGSRSTG